MTGTNLSGAPEQMLRQQFTSMITEYWRVSGPAVDKIIGQTHRPFTCDQSESPAVKDGPELSVPFSIVTDNDRQANFYTER